jgi:hypothetical protein
MERESKMAVLRTLEDGFQKPNPFTPDVVEETQDISWGAETPQSSIVDISEENRIIGVVFSDDQETSPSSNHPDLSSNIEPFKHGAPVLNDQSDESDTGSSDNELAKSAASLNFQKQSTAVQETTSQWMQRYPNMGVPDIDDELVDVNSDIVEPAQPASDSGYGSKVHIQQPKVSPSHDQVVEPTVISEQAKVTDDSASPPTLDKRKDDRTVRFNKIVSQRLPSEERTSTIQDKSKPLDYDEAPLPEELKDFEAGWCDRGFHVCI